MTDFSTKNFAQMSAKLLTQMAKSNKIYLLVYWPKILIDPLRSGATLFLSQVRFSVRLASFDSSGRNRDF